jgi:Xaa-Pro aminopeptidase
MPIPVIPEAEFRTRAERLQAIVAEAGLDAILVFSTECEPAGVRYFADYWPSFETAGVLVPREGQAVLLIGPESMTFAKAHSRIETIVRMKDFRESSQPDYPGSRLTGWRELLGGLGIAKLGVAGWHMLPQAIHAGLAEALGREQVTEADELVRRITLKKSPAELACLREAARISEQALAVVLDRIAPGMTEAQLAGIAAGAMLERGAEATGYPIWCCSGPNSNQAISRPTHRQVKEGEIVHFSIGAKVSGYSASIGRPVVLGHCPDPMRRFLQVGLDAENLTFDLMRAGTPAADVAARVHGFIAERGYGDTILYGPAHGCGQMECEFPFVETSSNFRLEPGMAFMADIFLSTPEMGFRWEDGLIVTDGEAEQLSKFKRELIVL